MVPFIVAGPSAPTAEATAAARSVTDIYGMVESVIGRR